MVGLIITLIIVGLIAGAIARLVMPGRDSIGFLGTIVLGIVGSFVGGFLGWAIFGDDKTEGWFQTSGLLGSIIGAIIVLFIWRRIGSGSGRRHLTYR
ncbi:MAG: GlsB/YeaQ/YmgE family stress response membrane protein [Gordonia polyisoprenivorans]|nr:GlsB/YeaQ/YmgE family stress response membrane protein [Gordonia polyisoprenivorans]